MKLSFAVFISLTLLNLSSIESVIIECDFYTSMDQNYVCHVKNKEIFTGERVNIEKAIGQHQLEKSNNDVQAFMIIKASNLKYFPRDLNNVFKNLMRLTVYKSNLTEITSEDLKVFPNLKFLEFGLNKIEVVRDGTFDFNQELKVINLNENKISHIDPLAFSKLPKLEILWLDGNVCKFDWAWNREEVLVIIKKIEQGFCNSDKI